MLKGEHREAFMKAERVELDGLDIMDTFEYVHYSQLPKGDGTRVSTIELTYYRHTGGTQSNQTA